MEVRGLAICCSVRCPILQITLPRPDITEVILHSTPSPLPASVCQRGGRTVYHARQYNVYSVMAESRSASTYRQNTTGASILP